MATKSKRRKQVPGKKAARATAATSQPSGNSSRAQRKPRQKFTPGERAGILREAANSGLTAKQVSEKYGVHPVTFYLWRKKAVTSGPAGRPSGQAKKALLTKEVVAESELIRQQVRAMLPAIVLEEVRAYLREKP